MNKRLLTNLRTFIPSNKRDDTEGTLVGNFALATDFKEFVFSWSDDRTNNRIIEADTVISDIPNLNGNGTIDVTLSADVTARAKTKAGRRLYRVKFTEDDVRYEMIIDENNKVIDRRG